MALGQETPRTSTITLLSAQLAQIDATNGAPTNITPIDLATNTAEKTIRVAARAIAITLNGQTAYALGENAVTPIDTTTNLPGKPVGLRGNPEAIALAPDGQTAWVLATPDRRLNPSSDQVTLSAINTATDAIGKVILLAGMAHVGRFFIAITPNGAHIDVLGQGSGKAASTLVAIAAATDVVSRPINVGTDATAIAVNPDSKLVYILTPGSDYQGPPVASQPKETLGTIIPIVAATDRAVKPIKVGLLASAMTVTS